MVKELTKAALRESFVLYEEDSSKVDRARWPPQCHVLSETLLDLSSVLCDELRELYEKHSDTENVEELQRDFWFPQKRYDSLLNHQGGKSKVSHTAQEDILNYCHNATIRANNIVNKGYPENQWGHLFRDFFFKPFEERQFCDTDARKTIRTNLYYDKFVMQQDSSWTNAQRIRPRTILKEPRPDFAFHFPIHRAESRRDGTEIRSGFPSPHSNHLEQHTDGGYFPSLHRNRSVETFSLPMLSHLARFDLHASTRKPLCDQGMKLEEAELYSYPWLVVELKKDKVTTNAIEYCYCQAANGASVSLSMFENAAAFAEDKREQKHVPPITTITSTGSDLRIWIAYSYEEEGQVFHRMDCIRRLSLTTLRHAIEFHTILDNLHTWAMRELRPLLSGYISQWSYRYPLGQPHMPDVESERLKADVEKSLHFSSEVTKMTSRLEKVGLSDYVTVAMVFREVFVAEHGDLMQHITKTFAELRTPAKDRTLNENDNADKESTHSERSTPNRKRQQFRGKGQTKTTSTASASTTPKRSDLHNDGSSLGPVGGPYRVIPKRTFGNTSLSSFSDPSPSDLFTFEPPGIPNGTGSPPSSRKDGYNLGTSSRRAMSTQNQTPSQRKIPDNLPPRSAYKTVSLFSTPNRSQSPGSPKSDDLDTATPIVRTARKKVVSTMRDTISDGSEHELDQSEEPVKGRQATVVSDDDGLDASTSNADGPDADGSDADASNADSDACETDSTATYDTESYCDTTEQYHHSDTDDH